MYRVNISLAIEVIEVMGTGRYLGMPSVRIREYLAKLNMKTLRVVNATYSIQPMSNNRKRTTDICMKCRSLNL
jgi:hypothetical protein